MDLKRFLAELKRRNVFKMAIAYAVVAWLLIQIATQVFPFFGIPNWTVRLVICLFLVGFPIALILAWVFELTPEGLKRTKEIVPEESISRSTGRKLDFVIIGVLLVVITLLIIERRGRAPASPQAAVFEKSLAVLPFQNMSEEKDNTFFADGVQDDILTALAKVADLKVISRTSVMGYAPNAKRDLRAIGQALRVAHVLEGSVRRAGGKVRVTVQLIDTRTNRNLWAETYDRDLADVFAIQSEIAQQITSQLQATLSPKEKSAIEQRPTADVAAFDLYTRARTLRLTTSFSLLARESLLQAADLLNQAVARDPAFFLAWCELATVHDLLYFFGDDHTPARLALAEEAIQKAVQLQPDSGAVHLTRAQHFYRGYLDYDQARAELTIAQSTLPNDPLTYELAGYIDRRRGHWAESARNFERAIELDPRNFYTLQQISFSYQSMRRYAEMAAVLDRALAIVPSDGDTKVMRALVDLDWRADPRPLHSTIETILAENPAATPIFADAWLLLALCERDLAAADRALAASTGNSFQIDAVLLSHAFGEGLLARLRGDAATAHAAFSTARAQQEEVVRTQPEYAPALCALALIDAGLGRKEEALRGGRRAVELLPVARDSINGALMIQFFAVICAWSGEKDLALEQLGIAIQIPGGVTYGELRLHPFWDPLRGDPRFEKMVASLAPKP